jgi:hypothetical protein
MEFLEAGCRVGSAKTRSVQLQSPLLRVEVAVAKARAATCPGCQILKILAEKSPKSGRKNSFTAHPRAWIFPPFPEKTSIMMPLIDLGSGSLERWPCQGSTELLGRAAARSVYCGMRMPCSSSALVSRVLLVALLVCFGCLSRAFEVRRPVALRPQDTRWQLMSSASSEDVSPTADRLQVLCLHGYMSCAEVFRDQLSPTLQLCSEYADFVFVDAPHELRLGGKRARGWVSENPVPKRKTKVLTATPHTTRY